MFVCGSNKNNELGLDKDFESIFLLRENNLLNNVRKVKPGLKHTIFITDNNVYGSGDNSKGALGIALGKLDLIKNKFSSLIKLDWGLPIKQIKTSWNNTYVLTGIRVY
jgi:alpha-tubulin suppressor-like RCC1 family protein